MESWQNFQYQNWETKEEKSHNLFSSTKSNAKFSLQNYIIDEYFLRSKREMGKMDSTPSQPFGWVVVSERSLVSNVWTFISHLHENEKIDEVDFALLRFKSFEFFKVLETDFNLNPCFIYLKDEPQNAFERIQLRRRVGEEGITLEYLQNLQEKYDAFYHQLSSPFFIVNLYDFKTQNGKIDIEALSHCIKDLFFQHYVNTCV